MEEEMKIKILNDREFEPLYERFCNDKKIIVENLGIEIKGLKGAEAEYIRNACRN